MSKNEVVFYDGRERPTVDRVDSVDRVAGCAWFAVCGVMSRCGLQARSTVGRGTFDW